MEDCIYYRRFLFFMIAFIGATRFRRIGVFFLDFSRPDRLPHLFTIISQHLVIWSSEDQQKSAKGFNSNDALGLLLMITKTLGKHSPVSACVYERFQQLASAQE